MLKAHSPGCPCCTSPPPCPYWVLCVLVSGCYPGVAPGSVVTVTTKPTDPGQTSVTHTGTVDAAGDRVCFHIANPFTGTIEITVETGDGCGSGSDQIGPFDNFCGFIVDEFTFPNAYSNPKSFICSGCVGYPISLAGCGCNGWWMPDTLHYSDAFGSCSLVWNGTGAWVGGYSFIPSSSVSLKLIDAYGLAECCQQDDPPVACPVTISATCEQELDAAGNLIGWRFNVTKTGHACRSQFDGTGAPCVDVGNCQLSPDGTGLAMTASGSTAFVPPGCGAINATGDLLCDGTCCPAVDMQSSFTITS